MVMKTTCLLLLALGSTCACAQDSPGANGHNIRVKWVVHGDDETCLQFGLMVTYEGHDFPLESTERGVFVPPSLEGVSGQNDGRVTVHARCNDFSLDFPDVYAHSLAENYWEFGVDYPPYVHEIGHAIPQRGTWASYMIWGVWEELKLHEEPFTGLRDTIANHQLDGLSYDKYDDAYAKAVLGIEYAKNRALLLAAFERCAKKDEIDPDDCQSNLGEHVINLYWRGDDALLQPMLDAAADKPEVLLEMGWFYAQLLSRKPELAVQRLERLPAEKQEIICRQAGKDEFWYDPPSQTDPVGNALNALGAIGRRCWNVALKAAQSGH